MTFNLSYASWLRNCSFEVYEFQANNAFRNQFQEGSTNRIHRLLSSYGTEFIRDNKSINRGEKLHLAVLVRISVTNVKKTFGPLGKLCKLSVTNYHPVTKVN